MQRMRTGRSLRAPRAASLTLWTAVLLTLALTASVALTGCGAAGGPKALAGSWTKTYADGSVAKLAFQANGIVVRTVPDGTASFSWSVSKDVLTIQPARALPIVFPYSVSADRLVIQASSALDTDNFVTSSEFAGTWARISAGSAP